MKRYHKIVDDLDKLDDIQKDANYIVIVEGRTKRNSFPDDNFMVDDE